jgi:hypothetical protein
MVGGNHKLGPSAARVRRAIGVAMALALTALTACGDDAIQPGELEDALRTAQSGDRLQLADETYTGTFVVPAGVTLLGKGPGTMIVGPSDREPALDITTGDRAVVVRNLTVLARGHIGIRATGAGAVRIHDVEVEVERGVGIGVEGVLALTMSDVRLRGAAGRGDISEIPLEPTPENSAAYGLVVIRAGAADLTDVDVTGFERFGALIVGSTTTWRGGNVSGNVGTGLMAHGSVANFENVRICDTLDGGRLVPPYGAVFSGGSEIDTTNLAVCDNAQYGILHDNVRVSHAGMRATNNQMAALWVQNSDEFRLGGFSALEDNGLAGVATVASRGIDIQDVTIQRTEERTRVLNLRGIVVADGIHMLDSTDEFRLQSVTLVDNDRVGLLIDDTGLVGASRSSRFIGDVVVTGSGESRGAIWQGTDVPEDWDDGIVRQRSVLENDATLTDRLSRLPELDGQPAVSSVESSGLIGIVGPSD